MSFVSLLLAVAVNLAPITGATAPWLNAPAAPATSGRVTIVDVFAFSCINCKHVLPELKRLRAGYGSNDLEIVGVHAPELAEERDHANLKRALVDQKITWPVVFDDDFSIWKAYGVDAWPTQLVFDRRGRLRATYVGEGFDDRLERTVKSLVAERT